MRLAGRSAAVQVAQDPPAQPVRTCYFGVAAGAADQGFQSNALVTAKYTWLSFLPRVLYEQFRRVANTYFLVISGLQIFTDLSPTGRYTTLLPLCFIVLLSALREALEDRRRHKSDNDVNGRPTTVVREGQLLVVRWRDLRVGDVVRIAEHDEVPADLLLLASSGQASEDAGGVRTARPCYVETSSLDGETNLKPRHPLQATSRCTSLAALSSLSGIVQCEAPSSGLRSFSGKMLLRGKEGLAVQGDQEISFDKDSMLLRGSQLRNTPFCFALVLFTGRDTKLALNGVAAPSKMSNVERSINRCIIHIFFALLALCTTSVIIENGFGLHMLDPASADGSAGLAKVQLGFEEVAAGIGHWYAPYAYEEERPSFHGWTWITFLLLYNTLWPISLYVAVEVCKHVQARLMEWDMQMYWPAKDARMQARTSNLNEDLGQIEYIFTDKTGTLTQNSMHFKRCSINGCYYTEDGRAGDDDVPQTFTLLPWNDLMSQARDGNSASIAVADFMLAMAACNTVVPEVLPSGDVVYQAASPDEGALVKATAAIGFELVKRTPRSMDFVVRNEKLEYKLLATNAFTSARKRMSVLIRERRGGPYILLCKGADDVLFEKLAADGDRALEEETMRHLSHFASQGLRTLVFAKRLVPDGVALSWMERYRKALNAINDREVKLEQLASEIEVQMHLLGVSAVEDRLQEGVPETIEQLQAAAIKFWMLTGDKQETAINVAYASKMLHERHRLLAISSTSLKSTRKLMAARYADMQLWLQRNKAAPGDPQSVAKLRRGLALVIEGAALQFCLDDSTLRSLLLRIVSECTTVIACRVGPKQKADIVGLVKRSLGESGGPAPMTLAIGDGANDVSMLLEAHIGVGVNGVEGMQAVRSSDFAISQFSFLSRLLLVHGFWNYRRVTLVAVFMIYKQFVLNFSLFWYNVLNAMSGTSLYDSWMIIAYSALYTFFPVLVVGTLDQWVRGETAVKYPQCYFVGQHNSLFNVRRMCLWIFSAVYQASLLALLMHYVWSLDGDGLGDTSIDVFGSVNHFCVVVIVNMKLALEVQTWTKYHHIAIWGCCAIWFAAQLAADALSPSLGTNFLGLTSAYGGVAQHALRLPKFWLSALLVPAAVLAPEIAVRAYLRCFHESALDRLQTIDRDVAAPRSHGGRTRVVAPTDAPAGVGGRPAAVGAAGAASRTRSLPLELEALRAWEEPGNRESQREEAGDVLEKLVVPMARFSLSFHDQGMERQFRAVLNGMVISRLKQVVALVILGGLGYIAFRLYVSSGCTDTLTQSCADVYLTISGVGGVMLLRLSLSLDFFSTRPQDILMSLFMVVTVLKTIIVPGFLTSASIPFLALVLRMRAPHHSFICFFELLVFLLYQLLICSMTDESACIAPYVLWQVILLWCLTASIALYGGRVAEATLRRDFVLQINLRSARAKSKAMLDNMLPAHVTEQLSKEGPGMVVASKEPLVGVLFCDILDFSKIVAKLSAVQLVTMLDQIWSLYDRLSEKHGVQKMETVGYTYMAVGGLNVEGCQPDVILKMALECIDLASKVRQPDGTHLEVRIGLHCGPVLSGVVGTKKPQFSLFGDTVNTTARMQSTGERMRVQMSMPIYQEWKQHVDAAGTFEEASEGLVFKPHKVYAKGKGDLDTFIVYRDEPADTLDGRLDAKAKRSGLGVSMSPKLQRGQLTRAANLSAMSRNSSLEKRERGDLSPRSSGSPRDSRRVRDSRALEQAPTPPQIRANRSNSSTLAVRPGAAQPAALADTGFKSRLSRSSSNSSIDFPGSDGSDSPPASPVMGRRRRRSVVAANVLASLVGIREAPTPLVETVESMEEDNVLLSRLTLAFKESVAIGFEKEKEKPDRFSRARRASDTGVAMLAAVSAAASSVGGGRFRRSSDTDRSEGGEASCASSASFSDRSASRQTTSTPSRSRGLKPGEDLAATAEGSSLGEGYTGRALHSRSGSSLAHAAGGEVTSPRSAVAGFSLDARLEAHSESSFTSRDETPASTGRAGRDRTPDTGRDAREENSCRGGLRGGTPAGKGEPKVELASTGIVASTASPGGSSVRPRRRSITGSMFGSDKRLQSVGRMTAAEADDEPQPPKMTAVMVSGKELERRYQEYSTRQMVRDMRLGLAVTALLTFTVGVIDVYKVLRYLPSAKSGLPFVMIEVVVSVVCCLARLLTSDKWLTRKPHRLAIAVNTTYVLVGTAISITNLTLIANMHFFNLSTVMLMLFFGLVGNISGLAFFHVLLVSITTFVVWVALVFGSVIACTFSDLSAAKNGLEWVCWSGMSSYLSAVFFLMLSVLLNVISSYLQEKYSRRKFVLLQRLKQETAKSDEFLHRMLPEQVVVQMKQGFQVADEYDDVFILATDICGFTKMSAASEPQEVVAILSRLFSSFDRMSERMGVYKVQTIGDAYIAVTGMLGKQQEEEDSASLPTTRRHQKNAVALVNFALGMLEEISRVEPPNERCDKLNMRIGIHVGSIIGGVIGTKRLRYDIWGADWLTAQTMESSGVPGEICVSEHVLKHLDGIFEFKKHDTVQLKAPTRDGSMKIDSYQLLRSPPGSTTARLSLR